MKSQKNIVYPTYFKSFTKVSTLLHYECNLAICCILSLLLFLVCTVQSLSKLHFVCFFFPPLCQSREIASQVSIICLLHSSVQNRKLSSEVHVKNISYQKVHPYFLFKLVYFILHKILLDSIAFIIELHLLIHFGTLQNSSLLAA